MYYLQSRYYNPTWGRFINADALVSTGQGILGNNMFAYCENNPVKNADHTGYLGICVLEDPMNLFRAFMTPGMFGSGGGAGGSVAGVSSSYYASQNVKKYDRWWRNSDYNLNTARSSGNGGNSGHGYAAPKGGGGVSSQVTVGRITVKFGHGGRHVDFADISGLERAIANDVVNRQPTTGKSISIDICYGGTWFTYRYFTLSATEISVGTYFYKTS